MYELKSIFNEYKIPADVVNKTVGCRITLYEIRLHPGKEITLVKRLLDEIGVRLGSESIRLIQIPENNTFGLEISNKEGRQVKIKDIIQSTEYKNSKQKFKFVIGESPDGKIIFDNLLDAKHLLIGGTTGSGKSVFINVLLMSLIKETPDDLKLILIDPKRVELTNYNGLPHLLAPVITEPIKALRALNWVNKKMEHRYKYLEEISKLNNISLKNIDDFNKILTEEQIKHKIPRIVVVIDELAQLLMTSPKDLENSIIKIAQLGRAAGIHLVVATQRPSADIITPLIKANFPTKVAFTVPTSTNSHIILDMSGAEKLLGKGDMLYMREDEVNPKRVQGAFISNYEIDKVLNYIKTQNDVPDYNDEIIKELDGKGNNIINMVSGNLYNRIYDEIGIKT